MVKMLLVIFSGVFVSLGFAQVDPVAMLPAAWFVSPEALFIAVALVSSWVTKMITALGKDWFKTRGKATVILSAVVAFLLGGVGGYFGLGYFTGVTGFAGALQAAFLTLVSWLGANASAKYDKQVCTKTAEETAKILVKEASASYAAGESIGVVAEAAVDTVKETVTGAVKQKAKTHLFDFIAKR